MEIHERIQELRKSLSLSRRAFGEKLGVSESVIVNIEFDRLKRPEQKEPIYKLICETFNVNEEWLKTGVGEMFKPLPLDETAMIVYDLLDEGDKNPFYEMIIEMMRTYQGLDDLSQKAMQNYFKELRENLQKKKEG